MDFLYNKDNGIAYPWSAEMEKNRSDLVKVGAEELKALSRGANLDEVLNSRVAEPPMVDLSLETETLVASVEAPSKEAVGDDGVVSVKSDMPKDADEKPVNGKGVVVKSANPTVARDMKDLFGNERADYRKYRKYYEIFPIEEFEKIPDEDLVRFANEALGRDGYMEAGEKLDAEERHKYYTMLRVQIRKNLEKDIRLKTRRIMIRDGKDAK